jgi:hypothetical protein
MEVDNPLIPTDPQDDLSIFTLRDLCDIRHKLTWIEKNIALKCISRDCVYAALIWDCCMCTSPPKCDIDCIYCIHNQSSVNRMNDVHNKTLEYLDHLPSNLGNDEHIEQFCDTYRRQRAYIAMILQELPTCLKRSIIASPISVAINLTNSHIDFKTNQMMDSFDNL